MFAIPSDAKCVSAADQTRQGMSALGQKRTSHRIFFYFVTWPGGCREDQDDDAGVLAR